MKTIKNYTVGILFNPDLTQVVLISKNRPEWQKGLLNFPGGHMESSESQCTCVSREFKEECCLDIPVSDWKLIGEITNPGTIQSPYPYNVFVLTAIYKPEYGRLDMGEDQKVDWYTIKHLNNPRITNIDWLIEFARNVHTQGTMDDLYYGVFQYQYKKGTK